MVEQNTKTLYELYQELGNATTDEEKKPILRQISAASEHPPKGRGINPPGIDGGYGPGHPSYQFAGQITVCCY